MTLSEQVNNKVKELIEWNDSNKPELLGNQLYDPTGWQELRKRQLDIKVMNKGIKEIAPHLDKQTQFVLDSLKRGLDDIGGDIEKLYDIFETFARSGPERYLTNLSVSKRSEKLAKNRQEYLYLWTEVIQNSTSLYTSIGLIKNASTTLRMQSKVADTVNASGGKTSTTATLTKLAKELDKLSDIVDNLSMALQELQTAIHKVKDTVSKRFPTMDTKQGKNQYVDKLYYTVLTEWLRVIPRAHKVQNTVRSLSADFGKLDGLKSIGMTHRIPRDTIPVLFSTYKAIDSDAKAIFNDYKPVSFETSPKEFGAILEINDNLLTSLEELF